MRTEFQAASTIQAGYHGKRARRNSLRAVPNDEGASNLNAAGEYVGTMVDGTNTFANWRRRVPREEKRKTILEYVHANQDDAVIEDRWRTKMLKRLTAQLREQRRAIESVEEWVKRAMPQEAGKAMPAAEPVRRKSSILEVYG